jgi:hypothetical protein
VGEQVCLGAGGTVAAPTEAAAKAIAFARAQLGFTRPTAHR